MKKFALLLSVIMLFSLVFTACSSSPAGEESASETTAPAPAGASEEALTENVFAGTDEAESTTENTEESIFYVG